MVVGTVILRTFIIITLFLVGITGGFPFLFIMIGIVGIGVIGTLLAIGKENFLRYL